MAVYLYTPPMWRNIVPMGGALNPGILTSTIVYRFAGTWHNVISVGEDDPVVADVDVDERTGLRLFFVKPMVIPGSLYDELSALEKGDASWTDAQLTLL